MCVSTSENCVSVMWSDQSTALQKLYVSFSIVVLSTHWKGIHGRPWGQKKEISLSPEMRVTKKISPRAAANIFFFFFFFNHFNWIF